LRELARDVVPVRPVARLRTVAVVGVFAWAAAVALNGLAGARWLEASGWSPTHIIAFAGLLVAGLAGLVAGLASAIPGREDAAQRGRSAVAWALLAASAAGFWAVIATAGAATPTLGAWVEGVVACFLRGLGLGLAPLLIAGVFVVRGACTQPRSAVALALAGSVGLGALAVHATCSMTHPLHVLFSHSLAPIIAALLLVLPLSLAVQGWNRRLLAR
jgi:hypothetical protein